MQCIVDTPYAWCSSPSLLITPLSPVECQGSTRFVCLALANTFHVSGTGYTFVAANLASAYDYQSTRNPSHARSVTYSRAISLYSPPVGTTDHSSLLLTGNNIQVLCQLTLIDFSISIHVCVRPVYRRTNRTLGQWSIQMSIHARRRKTITRQRVSLVQLAPFVAALPW